jgi:hypothetical protein
MIKALGTAALVASALLCSCTTTRWVHPDYPSQPGLWNRDVYECERDMRMAGYGDPKIDGSHETTMYLIARRNFFARCMYARGWEEQEVPVK